MPLLDREDEQPSRRTAGKWYAGGLRFKCTQCGRCCSGSPGYVFVTKKEIERIATFLGREGRGLTTRHLRRVGLRRSLTEEASSGDCCFLQRAEGKPTCRIYPVRPLQCRTWPFWKCNLKSPDAWTEASLNCPGMNNGKLHDFDRIETIRTARRWEDLPT